MILLLIIRLLVLVDAKSLTVVPSASFHGKDDKVETGDFIKELNAPEYEGYIVIQDETAPLPIQPRTNFRVDFTKDNGTEIIASRRTIFEVIPIDYLCDFCMAVIEKLKYRQKVEPDFEKNMQDECWKHNGTSLGDGNVCELINKVTLQRLQNDDLTKICVEEKMCPDREKALKAKEEREQKEREEEAKRKIEEEERKKNEEIENIKSEASRVEYEKRKEQETRKLAEQRRISHVNSETGEEEYVIDEVGKTEDDNNDYLDRSSEKHDQHDGQNKTQLETMASVENSSVPEKFESPSNSDRTTGTTRSSTTVTLDLVNIAPGRISGIASVEPSGRFFIDRTVELKLDVGDLRRR